MEYEYEFKEVIEILKQITEFTWLKDSRFKYIKVCIDTRDMKVVLRDRNDEIISLKQLKEVINEDWGV